MAADSGKSFAPSNAISRRGSQRGDRLAAKALGVPTSGVKHDGSGRRRRSRWRQEIEKLCEAAQADGSPQKEINAAKREYKDAEIDRAIAVHEAEKADEISSSISASRKLTALPREEVERDMAADKARSAAEDAAARKGLSSR